MPAIEFCDDNEPPILGAVDALKIIERRMGTIARSFVYLHGKHTKDRDPDSALREFSQRFETPFAGFECVAPEARALVDGVIRTMTREMFAIDNPRHREALENNVYAICLQCLKGHVGGLLMK